MITLPDTAAVDEIREVVERWVDLLVQEDYARALEMLYREPGEAHWTSTKLETWIHNYGYDEPLRDGSTYKVTPFAEAGPYPRTDSPAIDVDRENLFGLDPATYAGMVHANLPLNGSWSDLTARLKIRKVDQRALALELEDVTVM